MPADCIACSLNTLTVMGTSRNDSSRLRAVTTISPRSLVCAGTGVTGTTVTAVTSTANHFPFDAPISFSPYCFVISTRDHGRTVHVATQSEHGGGLPFSPPSSGLVRHPCHRHGASVHRGPAHLEPRRRARRAAAPHQPNDCAGPRTAPAASLLRCP